MAPEINHFDRGKPFYPLVINYIAAVHGVVELISRATSTTEGGPVTPLVAPLALNSKFQRRRIGVDIDEIGMELLSEGPYVLGSLRAAESLIIAAWETTHAYHAHDPLWEFLRHCRNAAAHGGRFHFTPREPRRPARWGRRFDITKSLSGRRLFDAGSAGGGEKGLLSQGDPLRLLWS